MTYGNGTTLGQGVDPRYGAVDYSPYVESSKDAAKTIKGVGDTVAGGIDLYKQGKDEEKKITALKKGTEARIDSAISLFGDKVPGLTEQLSQQKAMLSDTSLSIKDQGYHAQSIADNIDSTLNMFLKKSQFDMRQARSSDSAGAGEGSGEGGFIIP
jgi:hypothetical protein